jgi:hypothetical protein
MYTAKQLFMWSWKHCNIDATFDQLDGALCDHHRVSLHNMPSSASLTERAGQMKIEGGIYGSKLLKVAMSLAQQCAVLASPLQQDVLIQPTRRERKSNSPRQRRYIPQRTNISRRLNRG